MNKILFLLLCLLLSAHAKGQEKLSKEEQERRKKNVQAGNPFIKFGSKAGVATLSKGKYLEVHDLDTIVNIGSIRWHVEKQQIVGRIIHDTKNPDAQPTSDMPGRWLSTDPLSEEFPSWSPYNFAYNNPIRFTDPDGRAADDIITFMDNGSMQRTKTDDNFDILTNQSGNKSLKIDHKDGKSQLGEIQNKELRSSSVQYMLIGDNKVASDVFEFAASTTFNKQSNAEFGLDMFNFSDGFSMNLFQTGELSPLKMPTVSPLGQLGGIDLGNGHLIKNSNWIENNHSHPGNYDPLTPSGFTRGYKKGIPTFTADGDGDRSLLKRAQPYKQYIYGMEEGKQTYIEYDNKNAKIIDNSK